jgi:hypothetical protein
VEALRAGRFDEAQAVAAETLRTDEGNPYAWLVSAITGYKRTMHQLHSDAWTLFIALFRQSAINHRYFRFTLEQAAKDLARVESDLARAAVFPDLSLELCLACWKVDWNHNGRVDSADEAFLQIEVDAKGDRLPEDDPRRRPTFRFDQGDVAWARAFVSFQRAAIHLLLAYRWTEMDPSSIVRMVEGRGDAPRGILTIRMEQPEHVREARGLILAALDHADAARRAYLAETDDDREWLPNPRQQSHPLPLPVDDALYTIWEQVVGDLRRIVGGEEGLSVAELAQLGDHKWQHPPAGFLDIGAMLTRPKDIVLDLDLIVRYLTKDLDQPEKRPEPVLRSVLGKTYREHMRRSPLLGRLARMKQEVDRGKESLERKLRYLLWVN